MDTAEFCNKLEDALEITKVKLNENTVLKELDTYDSLAVLNIIALVDELFEKKLSAQQLASITTVKSLMDLIGLDHFTK